MAKRRSRKRQTRLLDVDGQLYLIVARRADVMVAIKLTGPKLELASRVLDDTHFEIEAHVIGFEPP